MKREQFELPAAPGAMRRGLPWALALMLLGSTAQAQNAGGFGREDEEKPPEDSSQHVDESDASYRQRMELRDQLPGQQTRIETTYSTPAGNAKIDKLPIPSQKHIKGQLREMIMENGQWEPGEDLSDYPYEPSPAAQTDAPLRGKEREAWSEELQKYQEREAAAYAQATGQEAGQEPGAEGQEPGEGSAGQPGEPGEQSGAEKGEKGEQGGSGTGSSQNSAAAAAARIARAEAAAAAYQGEGSVAPETKSTAGVSESALSYVQAMNGGSAGANPDGSQQQSGGQAGQQNSDQQSADGAAGQAAQMAQQGSNGQSVQPAEESAEQETGAEAPAGTIPAEDLKNLFAESGQSQGAAAAKSQGITYQSTQTLVVIEPGTLTIEELRKLDGNNPEKQ